MDFQLPTQLLELRARVRTFITEEVIPLEDGPRAGAHGPSEALRRELVGRARARQIARWTRQYRESCTESIVALDRLIEWLPERIPEGKSTAVVHGDYRLDNLVFDRSNARILGVIDWELATLGHPLAGHRTKSTAPCRPGLGRRTTLRCQ